MEGRFAKLFGEFVPKLSEFPIRNQEGKQQEESERVIWLLTTATGHLCQNKIHNLHIGLISLIQNGYQHKWRSNRICLPDRHIKLWLTCSNRYPRHKRNEGGYAHGTVYRLQKIHFNWLLLYKWYHRIFFRDSRMICKCILAGRGNIIALDLWKGHFIHQIQWLAFIHGDCSWRVSFLQQNFTHFLK